MVEQSGTPLILSFFSRFPIVSGCPRGGKCTICENSGVKCAPRGVVYKASCVKCSEGLAMVMNEHLIGPDRSTENITEARQNQSHAHDIIAGEHLSEEKFGVEHITEVIDGKKNLNHCYIGETSRPWRERVNRT